MQIPSDASGLTAGWLSDVLAAAPGGPFGPVAAVERQRIGEGVGVMSEIYRLAIRYAPDGRPGPATLVAKVPAGTAEARGLANNYGFYEKEVAFYRDIAPTVSIAAPRCFGAAFDPESKLFVLLMEDMAAVTPGDQIVGLTETQVRRAINEVAPLHARWWGDAGLPELEAVIPAHGQPPWDSVGRMHTAAWEIIAPWMKDRLSPEMMRVGERLCTDLQGLMDRNGQGQRTLCHGDFRADNLMFTGDPADPGLTVLDWQILVQAPGAFDIGYLMSASVTPDVRRSQEMDLLAGYHARLVAEGVGGYGFDECLEDYRRALLIGFTYAVQAGGFSNMEHARNAALIHAMATRCEAACLDLGLASMLN